jgi:hypothetical protein
MKTRILYFVSVLLMLCIPHIVSSQYHNDPINRSGGLLIKTNIDNSNHPGEHLRIAVGVGDFHNNYVADFGKSKIIFHRNFDLNGNLNVTGNINTAYVYTRGFEAGGSTSLVKGLLFGTTWRDASFSITSHKRSNDRYEYYVGSSINNPNGKLEIRNADNRITLYNKYTTISTEVRLRSDNSLLQIKGSEINFFDRYERKQKTVLGANQIKTGKVILDVGSFPDYVFANDYKLMSLTDVEKFISINKHLPNMPSEAEVVENGMSVGEINTKLVEKIEELTLYTIQQEKRINDQEDKLLKLIAEVKKLKGVSP